jgi:aminoglycoside phosphotransferase
MMCLTQGGSGDSLLDPGFADAQEFRRVLAPWLEGCAFEEAAHGESAARVLRVLRPGRAPAYLKYATGRDARSIVDEHERIQWLESRVAVPKVIAFHSTSHAAWLLTEALVGRNAADAATEAPRFVVAGMAHALRGLHATPAGDCPFDAALHLRLAAARERMEAGLVDEEDFDEARQGMHAQEVFASLMARIPADEECVVTHGDACPENFLFAGNAFIGFVDCGRAGVADRYQDLALASRNIESIFGIELAELFFAEYGESEPDKRRIEFYRMLDEFF